MAQGSASPPAFTKTFTATDTQLSALLYNFDVGSPLLKDAHRLYLTTNLKAYLAKNIPITVIGLASRTGKDAFNLTLSDARATNVAKFIQSLDAKQPLPTTSRLGEEAAWAAGVPDSQEDGWWRGVFLVVGGPEAPKGRHFDRLFIYDASQSIIRSMVTSNDDPRTYMIPAHGGADVNAYKFLTDWLDLLVANHTTFTNAVFITHGDPGKIYIGDDEFGPRNLATWQTKGYHKLFPQAGSRIYFAGCDVAAGDAGWAFLEAAGKIFLAGSGGISYGWTSLGVAVPSIIRFIGGHAVHLWGDVRHVVMAPGGIVAGRYVGEATEADRQQAQDAAAGKTSMQ